MKQNWFITFIAATAAFWAATILGPIVISIFNWIGYAFSGAGYSSDSFMGKALVFVSQPASCIFDFYWARNIVEEAKRYIIVFINQVLSVILFILLAITAQSVAALASHVVCAVIGIVLATLIAVDMAHKEEKAGENK